MHDTSPFVVELRSGRVWIVRNGQNWNRLPDRPVWLPQKTESDSTSLPTPRSSRLPKTWRWGLGFPSASSLHRRLRSALRSTRTVDRVFSKSNHIWISRRARGDKERADQHRTCSWAAASRLAPSSPSATSLSVGHQRIGAVPVRSFTPHQGFDTVCASFPFRCERH